jgi:hypothetical protein
MDSLADRMDTQVEMIAVVESNDRRCLGLWQPDGVSHKKIGLIMMLFLWRDRRLVL